jgi:hypothetical protein
MEKEELIKTLKLLTEGLENTNLNEELDKLKGECKRWKNVSFKILTWLVLALRRLSMSPDVWYFSTSNALKMIGMLIEDEDFVKSSESIAKEMFKEITGEEYVES